jgi:hypothetical protein
MSVPVLTMSKHEFERAVLLRKVHDKRLTQRKAAEVLQLSLRQVERLCQASVFRSNRPEPRGGDGVTQFGRALDDLNIDIICANSAPAKGRVERANSTLQDRLVKELRLRGISSIEAANA